MPFHLCPEIEWSDLGSSPAKELAGRTVQEVQVACKLQNETLYAKVCSGALQYEAAEHMVM